MHRVRWVMSDRAIRRSFRMMEGFGIQSFRFVNKRGRARWVKFHCRPLPGMYSGDWNEALKISGFDPDFHRRDWREAIENADYPEWEFGMQFESESGSPDSQTRNEMTAGDQLPARRDRCGARGRLHRGAQLEPSIDASCRRAYRRWHKIRAGIDGAIRQLSNQTSA